MRINFHERLMHAKPGESGITLGGEGVMYGILLLLIIGFIFFIVILVNILARKQISFYLWLAALIIVQTLAVINIG